MLYFKGEQHPIHPSFGGLCSCLNTEELSILAALPRNDIEGMSVGRIASFGLTQAHTKNAIELGNILNKKHRTSQRFTLSLEALNSHLFVSGATGGGKSNTIKHILLALQKIKTPIPFLVIEPAKSEYKNLLDKIPNLIVFRPGANNDTFRLNPFVFEHSCKNLTNNKGITLTKHIDMLKTTFSSAFPMVGPMPYILEDALYQIYVDKGWNLETEDNPSFVDSDNADYDRKMLLFPNMHDLYAKIESVVEQSGYAGEADNNIKAALKTRIKNLTLGIKGKIFNSRHCMSSKILFENPTIIELSAIVNDEEKAFLMGLLLNKLAMYREQTSEAESNALKHLCVIEEAHRLLPNISLDRSNEEANARGKAVEVFVNILSEIRSLGEGLVIADQIASKLHKDVIKNTNVKIVHRTIDREDRELVGNAINLSESQLLDIAELKKGEAIVHSNDVHQAFMVQIDRIALQTLPESAFEQASKHFLDANRQYRQYRYEYIDEECFAIAPNSKLARALGKIDTIDKQSLKGAWIQVLCASLFAPNVALQKWHDFRALLDVSPESSRAMRKEEDGQDQDALASYSEWFYHEQKAIDKLKNAAIAHGISDPEIYPVSSLYALLRCKVNKDYDDEDKLELFEKKFKRKFDDEWEKELITYLGIETFTKVINAHITHKPQKRWEELAAKMIKMIVAEKQRIEQKLLAHHDTQNLLLEISKLYDDEIQQLEIARGKSKEINGIVTTSKTYDIPEKITRQAIAFLQAYLYYEYDKQKATFYAVNRNWDFELSAFHKIDVTHQRNLKIDNTLQDTLQDFIQKQLKKIGNTTSLQLPKNVLTYYDTFSKHWALNGCLLAEYLEKILNIPSNPFRVIFDELIETKKKHLAMIQTKITKLQKIEEEKMQQLKTLQHIQNLL